MVATDPLLMDVGARSGAGAGAGSAAIGLSAAVEASLGTKPNFVDLSYPFCSLGLASDLEPFLGLLCPRDAAEREFLLRFRQHGGHQPLAIVDPASPTEVWPPATLPHRGKRAVAFAASLADAGQLALPVRESGGALLILAGDDDGGSVPRTFETFGFTTEKFTSDDGPSFWFCVSRDPHQAVPALRRPRRADGSPAVMERAVTLGAEARPVVPARLFVHDGSYPSEGDESYSWLWTGPSPHFRLIVPRLRRQRAARIEISIIRSEEPSNLDKLIVLVNGCAVPYQFDRWSDTSGKAVIDLPEADDYHVVSLVVPKVVKDAHGDRLLGLCVDKLIVIP